jgi:hypothetical protein
MTLPAQDHLERRLAQALSVGTWTCSAVIGVGFMISFWYRAGATIEMAGIAVFIMLPVARVALMLTAFLRRRELLFAALAALVLAIIIGGTAASLYTHAAA